MASTTRMPVTSQVLSTDASAPSTSILWYLRARPPRSALSKAPFVSGSWHPWCELVLSQAAHGRQRRQAVKANSFHLQLSSAEARCSSDNCQKITPAHYACWCSKAHPYVCVLLLFLAATTPAKIATAKPLTSDSRCAASVRMARLPPHPSTM